MKEITFILSSLNDTHFKKRVDEFLDHGYHVRVFGFKRKGQEIPSGLKYEPIVLGEIENRNFKARLSIFNRGIKKIAKECNNTLCFYSSLDVAIFARMFIKSPYIYEVCDLTELTISNPIVRRLLTLISRIIIRRSVKTIITSEGFAQYFSEVPSRHFYLIPNKVSPNIPQFVYNKKEVNFQKIRVGFVGVIRFESIYHFAQTCANYGGRVELHLHGIYSNADKWADKIKCMADTKDNIVYHGPFSNPTDLPSIYSNLDMVLCTYPPTLGVKYAEPNKLYEAIYFRCPIIVSENVFLGDKVERLNIGYVINAMDEKCIESFLINLNADDYQKKIHACESIPQKECLNDNNDFFSQLDTL